MMIEGLVARSDAKVVARFPGSTKKKKSAMERETSVR
jgi:hypothetical protein